MSYILDALKKSERERAKGNIPTLETVADSGVSRRALWLGVLIGAGALLLIVLAVWLVSLQFFRAGPLPGPASTAPATRVEGSSVPAPAEEEPARADASATQGGEVPEPETEPATRRADEEREPQAPQRVSEISELGPDAQARVRGLAVNVVSYSRSPERRFVMLDQRIFRESEMVDDGVIVKEILPEGVLLRVGNYEIVLSAD